MKHTVFSYVLMFVQWHINLDICRGKQLHVVSWILGLLFAPWEQAVGSLSPSTDWGCHVYFCRMAS